jgi:uncharacterized membrane protein
MGTHLQTIEARMNEAQASLRPHLGDLLARLAQTYGIPLGLAFLVATGGGVAVANAFPALPQSTLSVLLFAVNVLIFWYGWRWLERRTRATALYILYVRASRQRRTLANALAQARTGNTQAQNDLALLARAYEDAVAQFKAGLSEA